MTKKIESRQRREFLRSAHAVGLFFAVSPIAGPALGYSANRGLPLVADPAAILDLPEGFTYSVVSRSGGLMSDGFVRPGRPDGMECFADPEDETRCVLVRNHENWPDADDGGPFGDDNELVEKLNESQLYDRWADGRPFWGGVTTTVYDLANDKLVSDHLTLAGTSGNCAGGKTPWGSWLSCEESMLIPEDGAVQNHGYVFEVPASAREPVDAIPLKAMGRFAHEAAAVDPATDIVYLTEDSLDCLFYRFLPSERKNLAAGGTLQALAIDDWPSADTRNWPRDWGGAGAGRVKPGDRFKTRWITLDEVDNPNADLADRGFDAGAARFCRGEGMAFGIRPGSSQGEVFFNCTQGGAKRTGQVWSYRPGKNEGQKDEGPGELALVYESPGADYADLADNLALTPWGDLLLCEDGLGDQYLRGLTPDGTVYDLARNAHEDRNEFCGACFSPDGKVLFLNIQDPGYTLAIRGPWNTLSRRRQRS